jgi:beta-xylosidase
MISISPFRSGEVWEDESGQPINAHGGGVLFHEGCYYWYGEHKIEGTAGNVAQVGVRVYSSRDLYQWKDEGIVLPVSDDPTSEITRGCILERPKVVFNSQTKKFVMWFHLELKGVRYASARSGVAWANNPQGPFHYLGSMRPNAGAWPSNAPDELRRPLDQGELAALSKLQLTGGSVPYYPRDMIFRRDYSTGQMARDMTLFVDDDGVAYHIYASEENGTLHIARLDDDYLRHSGEYIRVFAGRFHEAPTMMKWRGEYFLITSDCTGWAPNTARVSRAPSIWGPWEELGNPCQSTGAQMANTFESQGAFILPVAGREGAFIFIADRWRPENAIDGRYVWLPILFRHGVPILEWKESWDLDIFDQTDF